MHKRSSRKSQARKIRGVIFRESFYDRTLCEVVSRVSRLDVIALMNGSVEVDHVPDIEKGEILLDSRGRGSFQRFSING